MTSYTRGTRVRVWWERIGESPPAGLEDGAQGTVDGEDGGAFYEEDFDSEGRPLYEVIFAGYGPDGEAGMFLCWHSQLEPVESGSQMGRTERADSA